MASGWPAIPAILQTIDCTNAGTAQFWELESPLQESKGEEHVDHDCFKGSRSRDTASTPGGRVVVSSRAESQLVFGKVILFSDKKRSAFHVRSDKVPWHWIQHILNKQKRGWNYQISLFICHYKVTKNNVLWQKTHGQFSPHYFLTILNFKRPISPLLLSSWFS